MRTESDGPRELRQCGSRWLAAHCLDLEHVNPRAGPQQIGAAPAGQVVHDALQSSTRFRPPGAAIASRSLPKGRPHERPKRCRTDWRRHSGPA